MSAKSNILLVDDVEENLVALEALLRRNDVEIHIARSGTQALEHILLREFSLALIDVQMPEMDGFELAELMRGAERSKYIPIIFVTAGARDALRVFRGYETGAVDFLFKPVDPHMMRQKVDTFVRLDSQKRLLAEQVAELKRMESELQMAVRSREDVLAVVSHDMRNFLQAIRSGAGLLLKNDASMTAEVKSTIHTRIRTTVDLMTRMIADLMDMANIRAGRISVTVRDQNVCDIVNEAVSVHEPVAQDKGIVLKSVLNAAELPARCDRERVLQVLANLIGNAIKFCNEGDAITITAEIHGEKIAVEVADTGPGIAPADLPYVFEPYWSGHGNGQQGTGLGLYITKRIIDEHGTNIDIESAVGHGTTVEFTLPRVMQATSKAES